MFNLLSLTLTALSVTSSSNKQKPKARRLMMEQHPITLAQLREITDAWAAANGTTFAYTHDGWHYYQTPTHPECGYWRYDYTFGDHRRYFLDQHGKVVSFQQQQPPQKPPQPKQQSRLETDPYAMQDGYNFQTVSGHFNHYQCPIMADIDTYASHYYVYANNNRYFYQNDSSAPIITTPQPLPHIPTYPAQPQSQHSSTNPIINGKTQTDWETEIDQAIASGDKEKLLMTYGKIQKKDRSIQLRSYAHRTKIYLLNQIFPKLPEEVQDKLKKETPEGQPMYRVDSQGHVLRI